jgi:hypothetical protein
MTFVVFYCYMVNDWEQKLTRQIDRLRKSGLYEAADGLYLYVTDPENNNRDKIENIIKDLPKITLDHTNINYGEGVRALSKVSQLSLEGDHKILYFHTKGVYNKYRNFETKEVNELKLKGVECWVDMMEFFLIDNWEKCTAKLNDNDIVGITCHGGWWWGNFWWARSSFIKQLGPFENHYTGSRWTAESWLHDANPNKENVKTCELNRFTYDPYYSVLPKYFYDNSINLDDIKIEIIDAKFGWFAEQRDEGRQLQCSEEKSMDVTEQTKKSIEENNNKLIINPYEIVNGLDDPAFGFDKQLRIRFKTNVDPKNEYVITTFSFWGIKIAS